MTEILEIRDKLKIFYSRNEVFLTPLMKFILAFLCFNTINAKIGYMTMLDNIAIVLILALMCSFLPYGAIVFLASVISLAHMFALAREVALVGVCVYIILYLLFIRLDSGDSVLVVITPLLFLYKIPYVLPIVVGLVGAPISAISIGCGIFVYFFLANVEGNASAINAMTDEDILKKVRLLIDGIIQNREMMVLIAAFAITLVIVYLLRRMSVDYSWTIAIIAGVIIDLLLLLVGDLLYDTNMSVLNAVIGSVIAVLIAKIIEFFGFFLDYNRVERVQFEDDEYYYYVKAVPKISVAAQTKTVKKINTQHSRGTGSASNGSRSASAGRQNAGQSARKYLPQEDDGQENGSGEFEELY